MLQFATGKVGAVLVTINPAYKSRELKYEEFLYTHPEISDIQVYGAPNEKYGEQVAAAVKLRPDSDLTAEAIKEYCCQSIAYYKVPEYIDFVEKDPMTASGKNQNYKLREAAVERYDLVAPAEAETA